MHAYSAPERLTPRRWTLRPLASSSRLRTTCSPFVTVGPLRPVAVAASRAAAGIAEAVTSSSATTQRRSDHGINLRVGGRRESVDMTPRTKAEYPFDTTAESG